MADVIDTNPVVSIVIPSYNSASTIRYCLNSLKAQKTELPFEIILIDSSRDGTNLIVEQEFPEVRMFHYHKRHFVGSARNIGIKKVKGEIVLFLDTDCIAPPNWIDQMYQTIFNKRADGIGGSIENGTPLSITGTAGFYLEFFRFLHKDELPSPTPFLIGANCGFRREVLKNARFNDHYNEKRIGEDFYFTWQLSKKGKRIIFVPSISVIHLNRTGLLKVLRYQYKLGLSACCYRYLVSTKIMRYFIKFPFLSFFLPILNIPWIGSFVLRRKGFIETLKFMSIFPLLYIYNYIWAAGFYRELIYIKSN